ncbi:MAG: beta-ketoacyl-[acyl-carrier-protein] synthase family protein [Candidatus Thiodiazotropha weberae]|uniref:beta-ketoacyl-[acyl-carrier-protein] synthase family protein n=1 Tax=Candidatus Thiodiazotropha endoloripes TaxID=1818881 RepID=UPI00083DA198|nr:beta-ketoacyl-[acyl-carrier-protein] synthase family protein [Candidatus Thiodiazotropha endoloripes]MCG7900734.1 beta-ketoacyl-[acyl-carrier-protein] synthase family protein [Candidatus Thiodiazotropha weberae]MCG7929516.1 beta-ketoacyl-[acyl-carrier-protein] synthase family protein [Candidatus Thiodiazotropha lotti]MCG7903441.1 beta-ketoacyl-[acyl-carrier-protein] synthase family protein [Candidatus Thiodiazotropha weberae]MCG7915565.1 beta-ketoacyl-[acyl-carrier-protein] synthase family p
MTPLSITHFTLTNALGCGKTASLEALRTGRSGLQPCDLENVDLATWIGRVSGLEDMPLEERVSDYDCRNNRLAQLALQQDDFLPAVKQAVERYGADRIGVFMGTSTSGIATTEAAYRTRINDALPAEFTPQYTHNIASSSHFIRDYLGLNGTAIAISTACSSSAKVFAAAYRYMTAGVCDAAIVGGVDSLCLTTLYGFNALDLVSAEPCRPWDGQRNGINIGEGAGFALLEKPQDGDSSPSLIGYGESSDAHHMSTPHPEGAGARHAMQQALQRAGLEIGDIDYINLHGTATRSNDASEDSAVCGLFGNLTPCSSTKGFTGHTLGAAGITESIFALLCLQDGLLPQSLQTRQQDDSLGANILLNPEQRELRHVLSNSFGFGGNNCSLIFGAAS